MNGAFKKVQADKIIRVAMGISLGLVVMHALYIAIHFLSLPPVLPLYNQMPWGETRLGSKFEIFIPLIITFSFFLFNYFLLAKLYTAMPLVSRILGITSLLVSVLSIIFIIRTLQLIL